MTETEESIESCIGVLSESIKSIQLEMNKSDENNFKLFYVSDMHNVGHTFNFCVCPYCKASHLYDFLAEKRTTIEGALPFQPHQIIMCILHVKQRLVENTVAYIASSVEWKDVVEGNLTKLPGLETFKWRELKERVSQYGVPTTCERSTVKSSMLSGPQCDTILCNIEKIVDGIDEPSRTQYLTVLKILRNLIITLELPETNNNKPEDVISKEKIVLLRKWIIAFLVKSYELWTDGVKAHYFHYIIHLPDMASMLLDLGLSLSMMSNQGFERSHLFHHSVFNRVLNNGGGRTKVDITKQLLLWQWRKVFLALSICNRTGVTYWDEKRLRKSYTWDESKVKQKSGLRDLYDYTLNIDDYTDNEAIEKITKALETSSTTNGHSTQDSQASTSTSSKKRKYNHTQTLVPPSQNNMFSTHIVTNSRPNQRR